MLLGQPELHAERLSKGRPGCGCRPRVHETGRCRFDEQKENKPRSDMAPAPRRGYGNIHVNEHLGGALAFATVRVANEMVIGTSLSEPGAHEGQLGQRAPLCGAFVRVDPFAMRSGFEAD